jgi:hypothetical protein
LRVKVTRFHLAMPLDFALAAAHQAQRRALHAPRTEGLRGRQRTPQHPGQMEPHPVVGRRGRGAGLGVEDRGIRV